MTSSARFCFLNESVHPFELLHGNGHLMTGQGYRKSQGRDQVGLHSFSLPKEVSVSVSFEKLSCTKLHLPYEKIISL